MVIDTISFLIYSLVSVENRNSRKIPKYAMKIQLEAAERKVRMKQEITKITIVNFPKLEHVPFTEGVHL